MKVGKQAENSIAQALSQSQLLEAIRIVGSYVVDSLPGGRYVLTPVGPDKIITTKSSHEECKSFFMHDRS